VRPDVTALREALFERVPEAATRPADVRVVRAPGRVNLIGEHTDYNDGVVLPMAIDLEIAIAFVPNGDRRIRLERLDTGEIDGFDLDAIGPRRGTWIDYVAGVAWFLAEAGLPLRGLRGVISSTLPIGAGLSSSAALELASGLAMLEADAQVDRLRLAQLSQRAENEYVGVNCGLMDQLAAALARSDGALLIDCRSLTWEAVPLPLGEVTVVAVDSGSPRRLETSEYNARRAECQAAVGALARADPSIRSLRDVSPDELSQLGSVLDPVVRRRAEHVVHENLRVAETVQALAAGDLAAVGRLFSESHGSLRDLYEVSSAELDALVEIAAGLPGVIGARMTGAGFGGCTVNLVRRDALSEFAQTIEREYPRRSGLQPRVLPVEPSEGAGYLQPIQ
jgi:galactokinase